MLGARLGDRSKPRVPRQPSWSLRPGGSRGVRAHRSGVRAGAAEAPSRRRGSPAGRQAA